LIIIFILATNILTIFAELISMELFLLKGHQYDNQSKTACSGWHNLMYLNTKRMCVSS
jgi:hypothetical protein